MPLPEIKLTLQYEDRYLSEKWEDRNENKVVVRTDTHFQKSLFSFLGIKRFDNTSFLYENIAFEAEKDSIESFELSRYRKLSNNSLSYQFQSGDKKLLIYAGSLENFAKPTDIDSYFIIVDSNEGQSFIGDISYREKMLKLTPKVMLQVVKRTKIAKEFSFDSKGKVQKLIYM